MELKCIFLKAHHFLLYFEIFSSFPFERCFPIPSTNLNLDKYYNVISFIHSFFGTYVLSVCLCTKSLHSCPTLCDTMDCSPSNSSVRGILQAMILERATMPSCRGIFLSQRLNPCLISYVSCNGRCVLYP